MIEATNAGSLGAIGSSSTNNSIAGQSLDKEEFLKLLVAQLEYQDPLQPMNDTEFVAQLSQFSQLEQLMNANDNLNLLALSQTSMNNGQMTALIGKEIEVNGDVLRHLQEGPEGINFELSGIAQQVTVEIRDAEGGLIRTIEAGAARAGVNTIGWDGKDNVGNMVPAGNYRINVSATNASGEEVSASTRYTGVVDGVSFSDGATVLEVAGTTVSLGDILSIRTPTQGQL